MSRKSSTETLIAAMRVLARDIQSGDGVANAAIAEAADRMAEQQARIAELEQANNRVILGSSDHVRGATKMAEQQARISELLAASDALIERWHTPLWKDARPTAEYIAALRLAAESARKLLEGGVE